VILTMAYMMSMWLAYLVQDYAIASIKQKSADTLQLAIHSIYHSPEYNYEARIAQEKDEFRDHVAILIAKTDDQAVKELLTSEMEELLSAVPFHLVDSKKLIENVPRIYHKTSPGIRLTDSSLTTRLGVWMTPRHSLTRKNPYTAAYGVTNATTPAAGSGQG